MRYQLDFHCGPAEIRRLLGYQPGQTEDSVVAQRLLASTMAQVGLVARPQGAATTWRLEWLPDGQLSLPEAGLTIASGDLRHLLRDATTVSLMLVTLGPGLDDLVDHLLRQERYAAAAVADATGSAAAEQAMDQLQSRLAEAAGGRGHCLTRRFSPGYGDVPLALQASLLPLLGAEELAVSLTSGQSLVPRKSITALAGWLPQPDSDADGGHKCESCQLINCQFRTTPAPPAESR